MSSPLMFVRDGRTLPFVPVTTVALAAIRESVEARRRPYAVATYIALLELANEARTDRVAVTQRLIVERVGAGRTTVQQALGDLQTACVLDVQERVHAGSRLENEYVVIEPEADTTDVAPPPATRATPARHTGDPRPPHEQRTQEPVEEGGDKSPPKPPRADAFPVDLSVDLHEAALEAGRILKRVALERGQAKTVTRLTVGHAVLTYADRDHVQVAREVEAWVLHGRGAQRSCRDVVARYRNFLSNADPRPGPPIPGSAAPRGAPSTGSSRLRDMAAALREDA